MLLVNEFICGHLVLGIVLLDLKLVFFLRQKLNFFELVKQSQTLGVVLARLVDPGEHFLDLALVIILHELGSSS